MNVILSRQFTLVLSEEEAELLKGIMQNPLWCESPENEDVLVKQLRFSIFNGLKSVMEDK